MSRSSSVAGSIGRRSDRVVGDGAGVARIGLVLAADRALPSPIDGNARHMDEREPGLSEHGLGQTRDAADDIQADADRTAQSSQFVGQGRDIGGRIGQFAVDLHGAVSVDGSDPVYLLGDVDSDADSHGAPWRLKVRHPAHAVFALHSDESQSLISGRGGAAVSGELPPEPSWAASMKTIPTPPPRRDPGMPGPRRQALLTQHLNGRAA